MVGRRRDNPCCLQSDGVENPCSSVQDGVGFLSPGITERLIPAHLTMLYGKECYSSHLSEGWHGFSEGFSEGVARWKSLGKCLNYFDHQESAKI